jgi:hypothetical protein
MLDRHFDPQKSLDEEQSVSTISPHSGETERWNHLPSATLPRAWTHWAPAIVFLGSFLILLVTRREITTSPPGVDQIGLMAEANFLYESGFDYEALRTLTPMDQGGACRAYVTTVLPSLIALFRVAGCSVQQSIVAYHLFIFIMAAGVCASFYVLLSRRTDPSTALLAMAAMAFTPLLSTQVDMITLEIPMVFFALLAAIAVSRQRLGWAILASFAAFAMKNTGIVVILAIASTVVFELLIGWNGNGSRIRRAVTIFCAGLLTVAEIAILYWGGTIQSRIDHPPVVSLLPTAMLFIPDLVILTVMAGVLTFLVLMQRFLFPLSGDGRVFGRAQAALLSLGSDWIFCWAMICGNIAVVTQITFHPRYMALSVPFIYAAFALGVVHITKSRSLPRAVLLALLAINAVNFDGRLFPRLPDELQRAGTFLERSHEYRENHDAVVQFVRELERACGNRPVLVSEIVSHFVSNPGLGYVDKPLTGYTTLPNLTAPTLKPALQLLVDKPSELIVVRFQELFRLDYWYEYPAPSNEDEILYEDHLEPPFCIYLKRFDSVSSKTPHDDFLIEMIAPWPQGKVAVEMLNEAGRPDLAKRYAEKIQAIQQGGNPANTGSVSNDSGTNL